MPGGDSRAGPRGHACWGSVAAVIAVLTSDGMERIQELRGGRDNEPRLISRHQSFRAVAAARERWVDDQGFRERLSDGGLVLPMFCEHLDKNDNAFAGET